MMTARWQPSNAAERLTRRTAGALLAVAVQTLFVAALLLWVVAPRPHVPRQQEIVFRLVPAAPPLRIIGVPAAPARRPAASLPAPIAAAPPAAAPPSGIAGIGRSLFGCAPENYANLTPEARAHCAKPGDGMAFNPPDGLMVGRSHAKDNSRWANAMAHKQILPMLPGGTLFPLVALGAILDGSVAEPHSALRDPEQWPAERDPQQFMPHSLDEQDRVYDAWRKDHPAPPQR